MTKSILKTIFESRKELKQFAPNGLILFALELFFNVDIANSSEALVDGPDDGGVDLVYIDQERKFIIIAQGYKRLDYKGTAVPASKVRALAQSIPLLVKMPLEKVPEILKSSVQELRELLSKNNIEKVYILYVHNLPESNAVKKELELVEHAAKAIFKDYGVESVEGKEIGVKTFEEGYKSLSTPILIQDSFKISIRGGMLMKGDNWEAFVTSVPASWLSEQFKKYGANLFSANVRDYLGVSRRSDKSINNNIQKTIQNDPKRFWVFNNGITCLVHKFTTRKETRGSFLVLKGISIVNGAQTTGAIGNSKSPLSSDAMVQVRFVRCNDPQTLKDIKLYNNSQNKIEAFDFRSNDSIQDRLSKEFLDIRNLRYSPRRGGVEDALTRKGKVLTSVVTGQLLSAFHGDPDIAYHQKTKIWEDDSLYSKYFPQNISAKHIFFIYSLFEAIRNKKILLRKQYRENKLNKAEQSQYNFFAMRGSTFLLLSAIANSLETFLNRSIPNLFRIEFQNNLSLEEGIKKWVPLVEIACAFASRLAEGFSEGAVRRERALEAIKTFSEFLVATKNINEKVYKDFAVNVET